MNALSPRNRDDLAAVTRYAARSVPRALSARGLAVKGWMAILLPACAVAPLAGSWAGWAIAPLFLVTVGLRALALLCLFRARPPAAAIAPDVLPCVTILLPLYREGALMPELVRSIRRLDYPPGLLDVIVLLEADDGETASAALRHAPGHWRVIVVPDGPPRTKPRACNVGLALAKGEVIVIFDAEDRPDPDQARRAVATLAADRGLAVVQARLACDHADGRAPILTRLWALEYDVLFGAIQPALARFGLPFLLGGTSNWFRTDALRSVGGWDAHNVTEDADLAVRLARLGWRSDVIDSFTWEEAPERRRVWLHQRARWMKGFAVTSIVHARQPVATARELGPAGTLAIFAQLHGTLLCAAAHPVGLALVLSGRIEGALGALAIGGYAVALALHLAVAHRAGAPKWLVAALPVYWLLHWCALMIALRDLVRDPAHWRKTTHALAKRPALAASEPPRAEIAETGRRRRPAARPNDHDRARDVERHAEGP